MTILRPVKGLDPYLYECLASTFLQVYSSNRVHVRFCVSTHDDPALPVLRRLLLDFQAFDAQLLVEEDDPPLQSRESFGLNPKIRNMTRAYHGAIGDIIWIVDSNVWLGKHSLGRMVQLIATNRFVHLLPLVVDTSGEENNQKALRVPNGPEAADKSTAVGQRATQTSLHTCVDFNFFGGRLEELYMSSSHAKFYTAINTVSLAPCVVGKSTMFRKSHLDALTNDQGIDFFSHNICEDHLIGDLLWKGRVPAEGGDSRLGKHAMCFGDLALQPIRNMSLSEYWDRRVRWLRVRKFTVTLATLVEPGTESLVCSLYGAYGVTTLPIFSIYLGVPATAMSLFVFWTLSVGIWCILDWTLYRKLHSAASAHVDEDTPSFSRPQIARRRRPFFAWVLAWLGRELLALPIWLWAFWGGTTVEWRGRKFWVGMDMKVHEIHGKPVDAGEATRSAVERKHQ